MIGLEVLKGTKKVYAQLDNGIISVLLNINSNKDNLKSEIIFSGLKENGENIDWIKEPLKLGDKITIRVK